MNLFRRIGRRIYINSRNLLIKVLSSNIDIGSNLNYRSCFRINCDDGGHLTIGDNVFFNNDCSINVHNNVEIGNNCIFGEGVKIYDHNHIFNVSDTPIYKQGFSNKEVRIGSNCWIGSNVVILPGTNIGENSVIGAGAVINGKIPENCIVVPNRDYKLNAIKYRSKTDVN